MKNEKVLKEATEAEEIRKGKRYMLIGFVSMLFFMVADWLLDVMGAGNEEIGVLVNSNWSQMAIWRFEASIVIASVAMPFYWLGIREFRKIIGKKCEGESGICRGMGWLFGISSMAGVIGFLYMHVMCCLFPIIFKIVDGTVQNVEVSAEITNQIGNYVYPSFFTYYIIADLGITIALIYFIMKGKLNVPKIAVLCNPVAGVVLSMVLEVVPIAVLHDVKVAFESMGYVFMFLMGYWHLQREQR